MKIVKKCISSNRNQIPRLHYITRNQIPLKTTDKRTSRDEKKLPNIVETNYMIVNIYTLLVSQFSRIYNNKYSQKRKQQKYFKILLS